MIFVIIAFISIIYILIEIKQAPTLPDDYDVSKEERQILKELKEKDESNIFRS